MEIVGLYDYLVIGTSRDTILMALFSMYSGKQDSSLDARAKFWRLLDSPNSNHAQVYMVCQKRNGTS